MVTPSQRLTDIKQIPPKLRHWISESIGRPFPAERQKQNFVLRYLCEETMSNGKFSNRKT